MFAFLIPFDFISRTATEFAIFSRASILFVAALFATPVSFGATLFATPVFIVKSFPDYLLCTGAVVVTTEFISDDDGEEGLSE